MRRDIRMALIPTEMERYFERTRLERKMKEKGDIFKDRRYFLLVRQYGYDNELWGHVVQGIMPTGLEHVFQSQLTMRLDIA